MMDTVKLEVSYREESGKTVAKKIRGEGQVPGTIYGDKKAAVSIRLNPLDLEKAFRGKHGKNQILDLSVKGDGKDISEIVIAYRFDVDAISRQLRHVDFFRVTENKAIKVKVPVVLLGSAPGVKFGGVLIQKLNELYIESTPKKLPESISVDISSLEIGGHIDVKHLEAAEGITFLSSPNDTIVRIAAPRVKGVDEEIADAEAAAAEAAEAGEDGENGDASDEAGASGGE